MTPRRGVGRCDTTGKVQHTQRQHAKDAARRCSPGERLSVWRCEDCDYWHSGGRRSTHLGEVVAQELLAAPGGVLSRDRLRELAVEIIGADRQHRLASNRSKGSLAGYLLRRELREMAWAGAVDRGPVEIRLLDPAKLSEYVESALARWERRDTEPPVEPDAPDRIGAA